MKKVGLYVCLSLFALPLSAQQKPNIIIILADDMGYGQLGCYGQKIVHTPNIDSLAAEGIRFTDYYAGSSVCAPSRECLLTGYHTGHTAIRGNFRLDVEDGNLPMAKDHPTIAEYLKKAGYRTALFGKWGVGDSATGPNTRGFDYSLCYIDQVKAHNYYPPYLWENDKKLLLPANQNGARGVYSHTLFVNKTLEYIHNVKKDQPFFLFLPYTIPHGDYTLPPDTPYIGNHWPKQFQVYATMVSLLDKSVGKIVQALKQKGIAENTVIFFISDNGANPGPDKFFHANGIFRGGKLTFYEGGIREPCIAWWPGKIGKGKVTDHITAAWDFLPTLCAMADVKIAGAIDGISFLPVLTGQNHRQRNHRFLYWEYYDYNYNWEKPNNKLPRNYLESIAVRMGKWKVVKNNLYKNKNTAMELYNLETDPSEKNDVARKHSDIIEAAMKIFKNSSVPDPPYFPYKEGN